MLITRGLITGGGGGAYKWDFTVYRVYGALLEGEQTRPDDPNFYWLYD